MSEFKDEIPDFDFHILHEDFEKLRKQDYADEKENPDEFRYWFDKMSSIGDSGDILIPKTEVIEIPYDLYSYMVSDRYNKDNTDKLGKYFYDRLGELKNSKELFIKTGLFSNKFMFSFPHYKDGDNFGEHILNVFYGAMCIGCPKSIDMVFREFIHTNNNRPSIYCGMKLNTEFRLFYDFDERRIYNIVNYWDKDTMLNSLSDSEIVNPKTGELEKCFDKTVFSSVADEIENDFNSLQGFLATVFMKNIKNVKDLHGKWSIDFLYDGERFWFIDMATAEHSYYNE